MADQRNRNDGGFTLIELLLVVGMVGVLSTALATGIITLLRSEPQISRSIAESHDQEQLTNYFVADARSTAAANVDFSPAAAGCPADSAGKNVVQFTFRSHDAAVGTWTRASYRLVATGSQPSRLDRIECSGSSSTESLPTTLTGGRRLNIADSLTSAPANWTNQLAPVAITPPGASGSATANLISISLTRSRGTITVTARLFSEFATLAIPPSSTSTTTTTTATTLPPATILPPATTTSSTISTSTSATIEQPPSPPPTVNIVPGSLCSLLANITASLSIPTAVSTLLRNDVTGALTQSYRISTAANVAVSVNVLGLLDLNLTVCATVQLAYNTGNTTVVVPMVTRTTCAVYLILACIGASVSLYVDLPAIGSQPWTSGTHHIQLFNNAGVRVGIGGGAGTVTVATDPTTTTTTTLPPATTTTTTTTTTTLPPATTPTVPPGAAFNPIAAAQGFAVMVDNDARLVDLHVAGAIAAGGKVSFSGYADVANAAASSFSVPGESVATGLIAGGRIDFASSGQTTLQVNRGFVHAGSLPGASAYTYESKLVVNQPAGPGAVGSTMPRVVVADTRQIDQTANPVIRPASFPFTTAFASLRASSSRIAALNPTSTCTSVSFPQIYEQSPGNWVLNLVPGRVNVINLTAATYNSITNLAGVGAPDANTQVIVNIVDYGTVTVQSKNWSQFQNGAKSSILYNFANVSTLNVSSTMYGTIYAPNADVIATSIHLQGDVIAKSFSATGGDISLARFTKAIPCIG